MFKFEPLLQEGQCYILSDFGVAENSGRLPLLPNRWKISFYKGTQVTKIDQIDDNIVGFINEPFSSILDSNNEYHEHDCVGKYVFVYFIFLCELVIIILSYIHLCNLLIFFFLFL